MTPASIRTLAARVYDQDELSDADRTFLAAIAHADNEWHEALQSANKAFGGGSETWHAVKRLATRQMEVAYARAVAAFEASDEEFAQAAE